MLTSHLAHCRLAVSDLPSASLTFGRDTSVPRGKSDGWTLVCGEFVMLDDKFSLMRYGDVMPSLRRDVMARETVWRPQDG
jgi:hypothetical protein